MNQEDCVQVIVVDKKNQEAEVTYLDGNIVIDGLGAPWMVYVASPGHHRDMRGLTVLGTVVAEGSVKRNAIPDTDPENDVCGKTFYRSEVSNDSTCGRKKNHDGEHNWHSDPENK